MASASAKASRAAPSGADTAVLGAPIKCLEMAPAPVQFYQGMTLTHMNGPFVICVVRARVRACVRACA